MASEPRLPDDPMGDDTRAAIVHALMDWWDESPTPEIAALPERIRRQMAMEAGAIARGLMSDLSELKRITAISEPDASRGKTPDSIAKGAMCNATDPTTGYLCCLVTHHPGPHIATDADETKLRGQVYAQWPRDGAQP